ncbi:Lead, cadmium, zinc and mercury-transporting ATPase [Mycobacterium basiliense]|uniref:Lead, cadmium, zinc and mercury-transporting ATPase n=1 Tax=Mycobacterium basiliense TaxID=2094119 RepID=A0A3S4BSC0_9MYCO|nr:Lead, cadmium, zinc and mercury-transporting ATPase [Mycobacterium basiliense]
MSKPTEVTDQRVEREQRIQLKISGMSCFACARRVESALNKLPGVRASVRFATRVATVDAGTDIDVAALCQAVRHAGYPAELCTDDGQSARHRPRHPLIRRALAAALFMSRACHSVVSR